MRVDLGKMYMMEEDVGSEGDALFLGSAIEIL